MTKKRASPPAPAQNLLATALQHHKTGQIAEAERCYRRALKAQPRNGGAHHMLGILLAQTGRAESAVESIRRAVDIEPENAAYLSNLGNAYSSTDDLESAVGAYRRAIALSPNLTDAHFNLGNTLRRNHQFAEAAEAYRSAIACDPEQPQIHTNLGVTLQQMFAYDEAVEALQQALRIDPNFVDAHYNLGVTLAAQGRLDEAIDAYRRAVLLSPRLARAHLNLGTTLRALDRLDDAIDAFRRATVADPDLAEAYANLGATYDDKGCPDEAIVALDRAVAIDPSNAKIHVRRGFLRQGMAELDGAIAAYGQALEAANGHIEAQANLAIALQMAGDRGRAQRIYDFPNLVAVERLTETSGLSDIQMFNARLAETIYGHSTLMRDRPQISTTGGSQTLELFTGASEVFGAFQAIVETKVTAYMADVMTDSNNPHMVSPPESWRLNGWGVVLRSSGYQWPHIHPHGIVSGVYYVQIPDIVATAGDSHAGCLRFGQSIIQDENERSQASFLQETVRPEEGMMVLFPSYVWHHTIPFESEQDRISIAFDVLPT